MFKKYLRSKEIDYHLNRLERFTTLLKDTPYMPGEFIENYTLLIHHEQLIIKKLKGLE